MFSAEASLHELFAANGLAFEDGEAVRLLDVPVPSRDRGGIFAGAEKPTTELIASVDAALRDHHGVLMDKWIVELARVRRKSLIRTVSDKRARFVKGLGVLPAHHARIAEHFGILAAAGSIASISGALPISQDVVNQMMSQVFRSVVDQIAARDIKTFQTWTKFWDLVRNSPALAEGQRAPMPHIDGFRRNVGTGGETIYLRRKSLMELAGETMFKAVILPELVRSGCVPATGEKTVPVAQNGLQRARYYRVSARTLDVLRQKIDTLLAQTPR